MAPTDFDWYELLSTQSELTEVNFWQPSAESGKFSAIAIGEPLFFKLKSPHNAIAGFGFFARYVRLPAWLAWDSFEIANGARTFREMHERVKRYRQTPLTDQSGSYEIGCILLAQPVFFPQHFWIPQPSDWKAQIVRGKGYDLTRGEGRRFWDACVERAAAIVSPVGGRESWNELPERYGELTIRLPRLGQGIFRVGVIDAYRRACSVSNEHSLPALDAAHIRPYAQGGEHQISNGLLLRSDIHKLFDKGYLTITPDYHVEVSRRLRSDFSNGRSYYPYHGKRIQIPNDAREQPRCEFLAWHNEHVFLA